MKTTKAPIYERDDQLQLLAEAFLCINQMESVSEVADFVSERVRAIIGSGYVVIALADDTGENLSVQAVKGLENHAALQTAMRIMKADPFKMQFPVKDLTPSELEVFSTSHLHVLGDGLYTLLCRQFPRVVCDAAQRLLNIRFIHIMGFRHHDRYLGSLSIYTDSAGCVEANRLVIENLVTQAAVIISRIRSEEQLRQSEERFRSLYENSCVGIYRTTPGGVVQMANPALVNMLGYSSLDDLVNRNLNAASFEPAYPRAEFLQNIEKDGSISGLESSWKRKDGSYIHVRESARAIRDGQGATMYYDGTVEDITERKLAEATLKESEARNLSLIQAFPDLLFVNHRDGEFLSVHTSHPEQLFAPPEAFLHKSVEAVMPGPIGAMFVKAFQDALDLKTLQELNYMLPIGGTERYYEARVTPRTADTVITMVRDISEHKHAEDGLRMMVDMLDTAPNAIFIHDFEGRFLYANRKCSELHGYEPAEFMALNLRDIDIAESAQLIAERMETIKAAGETSFEVAHTRKDGTIVPLDAFVKQVKWHGVPAVLSIHTDLTYRKQVEQNIKASLKEKETLLKEIHHRVKNNMQVISSMLELQSNFVKNDEDASLFRDSEARIRSMALVYNKLYRSKDLANINLNAYITELVNNLVASYGEMEGMIETKIEVDDLFLGLDAVIPAGLVINEIVVNSLKHAFKDGRHGAINISVRSMGADVLEMKIGDNGSGIPENVNADTSPTLGLMLIQTLVTEQLDGKCSISRAGGTEYTVTFKARLQKEPDRAPWESQIDLNQKVT